MIKTTPVQNKALVLEAFDTLFNKRDYNAAERYWSSNYIQHSAHIAPGRDGLFKIARQGPVASVTALDAPIQQSGEPSRTFPETSGTSPTMRS